MVLPHIGITPWYYPVWYYPPWYYPIWYYPPWYYPMVLPHMVSPHGMSLASRQALRAGSRPAGPSAENLLLYPFRQDLMMCLLS